LVALSSIVIGWAKNTRDSLTASPKICDDTPDSLSCLFETQRSTDWVRYFYPVVWSRILACKFSTFAARANNTRCYVGAWIDARRLPVCDDVL